MSFEKPGSNEEVMSEINMTPLVDVMLVLLIIFIITVPVMKQAVRVDLPMASSQANSATQPTMRLAVTAQGEYFLDEHTLADEELEKTLSTQFKVNPEMQIHVFADKEVRYDRVAILMSTIQRVGFRHIALVTSKSSN